MKLKLQYFSRLKQRADSLEKTPMLGKIGGKRRKWRQRIRWLDSINNSMNMNLSKLWEIVEDSGAWQSACSPWGREEPDTTQQLNNYRDGEGQGSTETRSKWIHSR